MEVSKSFVSKHITKLEKDLKSSLLNRSTRQLSLTEAGEVFYQHCQELFAVAELGYGALANLRKQPAGTLKITAPPALGIHLLANPLIKFGQRYPDVKITVALESHVVDLIQQGYDLALRSAPLPNSNLIAQKIATLRNTLCASPDYLKKHGLIKYPEELKKHVFAIYSVGDKTTQRIKFFREQKDFEITVNSYFQSNSLDLIAQMVIGGRCIAVLPEFMTITAVKKKLLVPCLSRYQLLDSPLYAVFPERKFVPLKVKMFIDELKAHLHN